MPGLLSNIKHHLPRIRLADSLVGTGLGLGLGAGTYGARRLMGADEEEVSLPQHLLAGGLLGLAGGNLAGDRARRYISNNALPAGYDQVSQLGMLRPRSLSQVFRTAIQDRPAEHVTEALKEHAGTLPNLGPFTLKARRELLRRGMGLPIREGEEVFRSLGKQHYTPQPTIPHPTEPSLVKYPGSGGIEGDYDTVEFDPAALGKAIEEKQPGVEFMLKNLPHRWRWDKRRLAGENVEPLPPTSWTAAPASPLLAGHGVDTDVPNQRMEISDLWDFAPSDKENKQLKQYLWQALANRKQLGQPAPDYPATLGTREIPTGWQHMRTLLMRKLFNDLAMRNGGVAFRQKFDMSGERPVPVWEKRQHGLNYQLGRQAGRLS